MINYDRYSTYYRHVAVHNLPLWQLKKSVDFFLNFRDTRASKYGTVPDMNGMYALGIQDLDVLRTHMSMFDSNIKEPA